MADAKFEEAIRLAFETSGTEGIKQAASIIASMGDVSEETRAQAAAMLDSIGNVEKTSAAAAQYQKIGAGIVDYQRQITEATAKVKAMSAAVKASEAPTKAQQRDLANARKELSDLNAAQDGELAKLRALKTLLDAQGVSTKSASASQRDLAVQTDAASTSLRKMVTDLQAEAAAQARVQEEAAAAAERAKAAQEAEAAAYARVQAGLALAVEKSTAALAAQRAEQSAYQAELSAEAEKAKKETNEYDAALKRVEKQLHKNKEAAVSGAEAAATSMEHTRGVLGMLKYMLVSIAAYTGAQGIYSGIKSILSTGDQFQKFQLQLQAIYRDAGKGKDAFAWVKQFAKTTPLQLDQVMQAFIQLKNFGIDPMNGVLQAAVDQNAKLGGESDRLMRITLAMGQAFSKGALQGQDIKQMIEAGVPVWQLLSEVTGKTTAELMKMSEAGKLGTDVMRKFFAQMGKDSAGASVEQMQLLSGQFSNLKDNIQQFEDRVSRKGVLDYFRDQLASLNAWFTKMADNGQLDQYAKRISDALIRMASAVKSATSFLIDHAAAIGNVAKLYATFKIARVTTELGAAAIKFVDTTNAARAAGAVLEGTGKKAGFLATALRRIPGGVRIAIAVVGFDLLVKAGKMLGELAAKHSGIEEKLAAQQQRINDSLRKRAETYMAMEQQYSRFANVEVLNAQQSAKLSGDERKSYAERLKGLEAYLVARSVEQRALHAIGQATQEDLDKTMAALKAARAGMASLKQGTELAADALKNKLSMGAQELREKLKGIDVDATLAGTRLKTLFENFQTDSITKIGDLALALANVANESQKADTAVRAGLKDTLTQLSSTDLLKFQSAATAAFDQYKVKAQDATAVTETVLQTALKRLGVDAQHWGLQMTDAARQNVAAFETVAENAAATANTIEAAFNKAVANAATVQSVEDLGAAMQAAGQQGRVGFDATARALATVRDRIDQLKAAVDPLADSFATLGIQSQRTLDAMAQKSHDAFTAILQGARDGKAAISDVRAAFESYSRTQLAATANAEPWKQAQTRAMLATQASVLGVTTHLDDMGTAGERAGDAVASGAHHATRALNDTAQAADSGGQHADNYANKSKKAAKDSSTAWVASGKRTSVALSGLSNAFLEALNAQNQYAGTPRVWLKKFNGIVAVWRQQTAALNEQVALLNKANGAYDDMAKRIDALRGEYTYLNDAQLQELATAQQALDEKRKREREARDSARKTSEQKAQEQAAKWRKELGLSDNDQDHIAGPRHATVTHRHEIKLELSSTQSATAVPARLNPQDTQRLAAEVVRQIGLSQRVSNR